ncbi:host attachment protein [Hyphococcus sp. DH-69]|uniref:host attachment protein n=1 Tax=Hyphococcus formosus TaxID=3143534 RepID=UPI00398B161A
MVTDGAKARLYESQGPRTDFSLKNEWLEKEARTPSRELDSERPVRGRTIGTGAPYAVDVPSSHEKAKAHFLSARAEDINAGHEDAKFDQLVIAAAPSALGILRKKLSTDVITKLIAILDKDLTNFSDQDLHSYFIERLERW